jgi:penicillin-binding protein 2
MAIGQGDLLVTPLQMAQAFSIIANRGIKYTPHLCKEIIDNEGVIFTDESTGNYEDLNLNENFIEAIEKGLIEVLAPGGTGYSVFSDFPLGSISIAAKTGTAEFLGKQDYGWFASYAPAGNPEYVVVAMLEEGGSGGSNVGPLVEKIYKYLFNVN